MISYVVRNQPLGTPLIVILFLWSQWGCSNNGPDMVDDTGTVSSTDTERDGGERDGGISDAGPEPSVCNPYDTDPNGPVCSQRVTTDAEFDQLSLETASIQYWDRATKFMVPVSDDPDLIPPLLQNSNRYPLHLEFLSEVFMPDLTGQRYREIVMRRTSRLYYAGNFIRIVDSIEGEFYGFTIYTSATPSELLEPVEVQYVFDQLESVFTAGELVFTFEPFDAMGPAKAKRWVNPGFPIYFPKHDEIKVEVYTPGVCYGRVKRFTLEEFESAALAGLIGYSDLVVIDAVPFDIEQVVAGVVTGGRQWELSHVNVRMGRRGTPNLYVKDALAEFDSWEDQLVKLVVQKRADGSTTDSYTVVAADQEEAEAWWADHRPKLADIPEVDAEYTALDSLTEMDVDDTLICLISRFGGKAANLAKLYAFLDEEVQVPGFGIPFAHFETFLASNHIVDQLASPPETVTLREYIDRLAADTAVRQDATLRRRLLLDLRERIQTEGRVPEELVDDLADQIRTVFGSSDVKVKFRSSSNVEDSLEFSGAGLYNSTPVCAEDSTDPDLLGPSACDSNNSEEKTIERGLLKVWSSLYNDRAWEEREWYQVPQEAASMAILVTLAFPDEIANGVAFTGDPSNPNETRYLINAQVGDENVVGNDAHLVPEMDLLEITDGVVSRIYRVRSSVLAEPGVPVLSDEQLLILGGLMAEIDDQYPLDLGTHHREEVLLDMEFKIDRATEGIKIKQIRPFLLSAKDIAP
jgi:pyruvate, water dikinase